MINFKKSGIYSITHIPSNKRYVGQAVNIYVRFNTHRNTLNRNKHHSILLQRAWDKYEEDQFIFEVLEYVVDVSKLVEREQYWMDYYKSYDPEKGYNLHPSSVSPLGYKHTPETKAKMSIISTGRRHSIITLKKLSNMKKGSNNPMFGKKPYNFGKSPSFDTRNKMSLGKKDKKPAPFTEEHIKHMSESKLGKNNPNFGKIFSPEYRMLIRLGVLKNTKPGRLSGCKLRTWVTTGGKVKSHWIATIRIGKIRKYLGSFKTEQEAHEAYLKALNNLGGK